MKYPTDLPVKAVMLGAGGTGGHIAPHLYRLLYSLDRPARFIICDGDIVEEKNLVRQNFAPADLGQNKAKAVAERYAGVFGMETEYVSDFVEDLDVLEKLIKPGFWEFGPHSFPRAPEMVILIGAVDNNKSRKLCHEAFYRARDLIYIDSGNSEFSGQVVCGVHPEMLKDTDKFPTEVSCAEAAQADPQSIVANLTAATAVVNMVYNILAHGESLARQTDFSTRTIRMQTILEKQRRKAA